MEADDSSKQCAAPLKVLYFRHAYSHWNKFKDTLAPGSDPQASVDLDGKFVDPGITLDQGVEEARSLGAALTPHVKAIRTVFVSPLVRAIQTADIAFSQHAEHQHIRFIVHPLLMPRIGHPTDLSLLWRKYTNKSIIRFDTSLIERFAEEPAWQFSYLLQQKLPDEVVGSALESARREMNAGRDPLDSFNRYNSYFNQHRQTLSENDGQLDARLERFADSVSSHTQNQGFSQADSLVIVSHGGIIKRLFGSKPKPAKLVVADTSSLSV